MPAFALAREGEAQCLRRDYIALLPSLGQVVNDDIIAFALCSEVSIHNFGFEPAGRDHLFFKILQDRPVLGLDQAAVIFLRGGLQLPLILE